MMMRRSVFLGAIAAAFLLAMPVAATAEMIVAYFEDALGKSTDYVDAYQGKGGEGWTGGWTNWSTGGTGTVSGTVLDTNPLNSSGNYFSATLTNTKEGQTSYAVGLARNYKDAGALDFDKDFTIDYSIRIDGDFDTTPTNRDVVIFRIGHENYYTSKGTECVTVYMRGDGMLRFYDGSATILAENFPVTVGDVYDFSINVYVADRKWDVEVTNTDADPPQNTYKSPLMSWRGTNTLGKYIGFYAQELTYSESFDFALDNIEISQVPEPSALALLTAGLVGFLIRRSK